MKRLVLLVSDTDPNGSAGFVPMLVQGLTKQQFAPTVVVLGRTAGELGQRLAHMCPDCRVIALTHAARVNHWRGFQRTVLRDLQPDVLHAIGPFAARLTYLHIGMPIGRVAKLPSILVSAADVAPGEITAWLTRRAVRAADRVVAATEAEANRYHKDGVAPERIEIISPPASEPSLDLDPVSFRTALDIPPTGRLIIAAGKFEVSAGLKAAVWAFDGLRYVDPDLYLVLVGEGPERERLERFGRSVGFDDFRIRFLKPPADLAAVMAQAEYVWVTHPIGGVRETLAALAAGRPVIAVANPDLDGMIEPGVTGRFVAVNDRVGLAAVTNELLTTPEVARRYGDAGRTLVREKFSPMTFVDRMTSLYHSMSPTFPAD